jgi:RNA polymerase sigma-70 factor (ECF subfamily)
MDPMADEKTRPDMTSDESQLHQDFTQTHWTTVLEAQATSVSGFEALNKLCQKYWRPVYAFIRRKWGQHSHHKAEDLTQGFFAEFIRKFPDLEISPEKGKFRTYLLACLNRYLCKDWERSPSASREVVIPPEDFEQVAANGDRIASSASAPERVFDAEWATTLARNAMATLREEYVAAGKANIHARLLPLLTGRAAEGAYETMAADLQMSEGALRVASHQFRRRFGQLLRDEVANTVGRPEDTDDELRYLLSLWGADQTAGTA